MVNMRDRAYTTSNIIGHTFYRNFCHIIFAINFGAPPTLGSVWIRMASSQQQLNCTHRIFHIQRRDSISNIATQPTDFLH